MVFSNGNIPRSWNFSNIKAVSSILRCTRKGPYFLSFVELLSFLPQDSAACFKRTMTTSPTLNRFDKTAMLYKQRLCIEELVARCRLARTSAKCIISSSLVFQPVRGFTLRVRELQQISGVRRNLGIDKSETEFCRWSG